MYSLPPSFDAISTKKKVYWVCSLKGTRPCAKEWAVNVSEDNNCHVQKSPVLILPGVHLCTQDTVDVTRCLPTQLLVSLPWPMGWGRMRHTARVAGPVAKLPGTHPLAGARPSHRLHHNTSVSHMTSSGRPAIDMHRTIHTANPRNTLYRYIMASR